MLTKDDYETRVVKPFGTQKVGDKPTINMTRALRIWLLHLGYIEDVKRDQAPDHELSENSDR